MKCSASESKKRRVMEAAEKLFAERRIHEVTLDEVARRARVGKGTIYLYFENKDDLFYQVALSGFDALCDRLGKVLDTQGPFAERLAEACAQVSRFFERRRVIYRLMQAESARASSGERRLVERWLTQRRRLVSAVAAILQQGVDEGAVRSDLPTDLLADLLLGMLRTRGRGLTHIPPAYRQYEVLVDFFLHGAAHNGAADRSR